MPAEAVAGRVAREQPSEPSDGEIDRLGTWQGAVASGISPASGREDWQVHLAMWPRSPHETSQDQPSSALCPRCVDALGPPGTGGPGSARASTGISTLDRTSLPGSESLLGKVPPRKREVPTGAVQGGRRLRLRSATILTHERDRAREVDGAPRAGSGGEPVLAAVAAPGQPVPVAELPGGGCRLRRCTPYMIYSAGVENAPPRLLASPDDLTACEAVRAVATGQRSVEAVTTAALQRLAEVESELQAWRSLDPTAALLGAKELDRSPAGVLRGTLAGVKDVIDTADLPTGYGSPLFAEHQPAEDAEVVRRLRRAGALVLGKTESTEFAMYQPTRTRNPVDPARTPGGSSSGSAAAVAAGVVPVAFGTQTAGSVIRPASYCGVYGFKPSRGWTSTEGVFLLAQSLDTIGLFARRVADLRLLYEALRSSDHARRRPRRRLRSGRSRTAAVLRAGEWGEVESDVLSALDRAGGSLGTAGWEVVEMAMPGAWRDLPEHHARVMAVEVARNMRAVLGERVDLVSPSARAIVERGDSTPAVDYLTSLAAARDAGRLLAALAASVDVILAPSALGVAPVGLDFTGDPVMCRPWTLLGLPCCNVPAHRRPDGLPVGVQAVGPAFDDSAFLDDLEAIESALAAG